MLLLLACATSEPDTSAPVDTGGADDTGVVVPWDGPLATARGVAVNFALEGGVLVGASVATLEVPTATGLTGEDGTFALDAPAGGEATFVLTNPGVPPIQTGTLDVPTEGIDGVTFQVPDDEMYELMAAFSGVEPDPAACQIATTVTCAGCDMWHGAFHGEPGATVTIDPPLPAEHGPVYFYRNSTNGIIWPDPALAETTEDGGVLFLNVPPGRYTLRAHKDGVSFDERKMWCRAGWLVNASPPYGVNVLAGG